MSFSVLISVYHKEQGEFLRLSLESVMTQTLMPDEVVLVKDGPLTADLDSVCNEFVERHPDIFKIIALPENVGLGRALNEGLKHCSYDLVARMDSDDICKAHRFEKQIAVFKSMPEVSVVGSWVDEFADEITNVISIRKLPENDEDLKRFALKRNPLNHPSVMFRKVDVESVGSYPPLHLIQDYYLWLLLIKAGCKLYNIQESLIYFRTSSDMMARRGGFKYAMKEVDLFRFMRKKGIIGWGTFVMNILTRFPVRVMPIFVRRFIYNKILR